jgi:hypothetical protein
LPPNSGRAAAIWTISRLPYGCRPLVWRSVTLPQLQFVLSINSSHFFAAAAAAAASRLMDCASL